MLETQACGTQLCPGNAVIPSSDQCPPTQICPDNSIMLASEACEIQKCPDGAIIPVGRQCAVPVPKKEIVPPPVEASMKCPGGEIVGAGEQCPTCLSCRFLPLTRDTAPYWVALAALVILVGVGGVAGAKAYQKVRHAQLVAKTAELLRVSSSLDPSGGAFQTNGLKIDGPSVRLRAYLDPGES